LIQWKTKFSKVKPLYGAIAEPECPTFSYESFIAGSYQEKFEKYYNEDFGFRPSFIRLNNQIKYWFFNKAQANGVIIGKEGYLYEYNYIKAYYGLDYIGKDSIENNVTRLKYVQAKLEEMNKTLIIVLAPGKGSFFPEYFPDSSIRQKGRTNYEAFLESMLKNKLNVVDMNSWFLKMKPTSKYPLFPKGGIHWSKYGEIIAMDSLLKFIESKSGLEYPSVNITSVEMSAKNKERDYDIGEGLNLIFQSSTYPMAYPTFEIKNPELNKHKTTVIADSYYWGMFNAGFSSVLFNNGKFWFYNQEVYPDHYEKPTLAHNIDFKKEISENEVIILLSTDANLYRFPFGFSELFIQNFPQKK
ncbi:MAG: alginate O-acetyltransferase AlgX-related protein, partial [Crocinitomicaceae bacterium]